MAFFREIHNARMLLIGLFAAVGCGYSGPIMTVEELKTALDEGTREITVVDVRPAVQFKAGHVPGAINHPLEGFTQSLENFRSLKGEAAIICTCGRRSLAAVKQLRERGLKPILVEGGMKKWNARGFPVEKDKH